MILVENVDVYGWETAIRGMRNPMNSWDKSDSFTYDEDVSGENCGIRMGDSSPMVVYIGPNDLKLMKNLAKAGTDHAKYLRMINVTMDITAPLYFLKEWDTYKVGTVANSCSTMHKIHDKEFTLDDFSHEHLIGMMDNDYPCKIYPNMADAYYGGWFPIDILGITIDMLNEVRDKYLETNDKKYWWQMIQLLPSSYNQRRTVQMNYQVCWNMYQARKNHKLTEWVDLCKEFERLPYFKEVFLDDLG